MPLVLAVGDCLIDEVTGEVETRRFAGGAALNLSVNLVRAGHPTGLIAMVGRDELGQELLRYVANAGVTLVGSADAEATAVARSVRVNGEPRYWFNDAMSNRVVPLGEPARTYFAAAPATLISSFPFESAEQTATLRDLVRGTAGLVAIDPNPRPALLSDRAAFVAGFESLVPFADIVKFSHEDIHLMYPDVEPEGALLEVAGRIWGLGSPVVLFTLGDAGAEVYVRGGLLVHEPIALMDGLVLDTMGAGDAALAAIIAQLLDTAEPLHSVNADRWATILRGSMIASARVCRVVGPSA